jgi:hypothetical protein
MNEFTPRAAVDYAQAIVADHARLARASVDRRTWKPEPRLTRVQNRTALVERHLPGILPLSPSYDALFRWYLRAIEAGVRFPAAAPRAASRFSPPSRLVGTALALGALAGSVGIALRSIDFLGGAAALLMVSALAALVRRGAR